MFLDLFLNNFVYSFFSFEMRACRANKNQQWEAGVTSLKDSWSKRRPQSLVWLLITLKKALFCLFFVCLILFWAFLEI